MTKYKLGDLVRVTANREISQPFTGAAIITQVFSKADPDNVVDLTGVFDYRVHTLEVRLGDSHSRAAAGESWLVLESDLDRGTEIT